MPNQYSWHVLYEIYNFIFHLTETRVEFICASSLSGSFKGTSKQVCANEKRSGKDEHKEPFSFLYIAGKINIISMEILECRNAR